MSSRNPNGRRSPPSGQLLPLLPFPKAPPLPECSKHERNRPLAPLPAASMPASRESLAEALRIARDGMALLQKMQEETAQLHRRFLEGQETAGRTFQSLLEHQQRLIQGESGTAAPLALRLPAPVYVPPTTAVPSEPAFVPAPTGDADDRVARTLVAVVSEKTGYPAEMLDLDMELEADLGIDSIKRVEILSALRERLPAPPSIDPEHLGALRRSARSSRSSARPRRGPPRLQRHAAGGMPGRRRHRWREPCSRSWPRRPATRPRCSTSTWISRPTSASTRSSGSRSSRRCGSARPTPPPIGPDAARHAAHARTDRASTSSGREPPPCRPPTAGAASTETASGGGRRRPAAGREALMRRRGREDRLPDGDARRSTWSSRPTSASTRSSAWRSSPPCRNVCRGSPVIGPEHLGTLATLGEIAGYLARRAGPGTCASRTASD